MMTMNLETGNTFYAKAPLADWSDELLANQEKMTFDSLNGAAERLAELLRNDPAADVAHQLDFMRETASRHHQICAEQQRRTWDWVNGNG